MGQLFNGVWQPGAVASGDASGRYIRPRPRFRDWVTRDGSPGPNGADAFPAEKGRYHLYVSFACPWSHQTLIYRMIKELEDVVSVSILHPEMLEEGWSFATDYADTTGDTLYGLPFLRDIYTKAQPDYTGHATVPVLWDKERETIVSNDSGDIIRMFNSAFDDITGNTLDFYPEEQRDPIEELNSRIYSTLNNGVYRCGLARSQDAYNEAVIDLSDTLEWLETRLSSSRYLLGEHVTEADWRLAVTLFRFDLAYHTLFKCNRWYIRELPALWGYARDLYQWTGVPETVNFEHIVRHYHLSYDNVHPFPIVPINPVLDWTDADVVAQRSQVSKPARGRRRSRPNPAAARLSG